VVNNDLDPFVRQTLPKVASFNAETRRTEIEGLVRFLVPGAQRTRGESGLLPSIGIILDSSRIQAQSVVLSPPELLVAGVRTPGAASFGREVEKARFNVQPNQVNVLNVILVHHKQLEKSALTGESRGDLI